MIRVLPQTLINQIAAGEVVVRMANVAKELVENSIDAGATMIELELSGDLRDLDIRDNGIGMNRDDAELSLQRHATSKITSAEDLTRLMTRGFRGEALPSIASVSRFEMQTRPAREDRGTRIVVEGGRILRIEPVGCPVGTRIIVRDLFYNTPARRNFLKTTVGEGNAVLHTLTRQALAQPAIGFRCSKEGRVLLALPESQSLVDRYTTLMASHVKRPPLPLSFEREGIVVSGLLAHPEDSRSDRRGQYFFVNERPFSSRAVAAALEQACRGFVMVGRQPAGCFFLSVPPETVDFNVHPTKEEVRFHDESLVAGTLFHAAKHALEGSPALIGEVQLRGGDSPLSEAMATTATHRPQDAIPSFFRSTEQLIQRSFDRKLSGGRQQDILTNGQPAAPVSSTAKEQPIALTSAGAPAYASPGEKPDGDFWSRAADLEPLGQVALTYLVARYGEDLLLIDQHAVHERLVYLALRREQSAPPTQPLLMPITFEVSAEQDEALRAAQESLREGGIDLAEFGPRTWAIQSLPADLPPFDPVPMLMEIADDFLEVRRRDALAEWRDRLLIRTACHAAIRAGEELGLAQQRALLAQIRAERLSLTCPHGRPTIVRLSKGELDRQFKRIV